MNNHKSPRNACFFSRGARACNMSPTHLTVTNTTKSQGKPARVNKGERLNMIVKYFLSFRKCRVIKFMSILRFECFRCLDIEHSAVFFKTQSTHKLTFHLPFIERTGAPSRQDKVVASKFRIGTIIA